MNLTRRPRRLRRTAQIRNLVHEVDVRCDDLIYPVFVTEGENLPLFSGQTGYSFERSVGERCACRYLFRGAGS